MIGEDKKIPIYIGSDHAGFKSKGELKTFLEKEGYEVTDLGAFNDESSDYPDFAREVSEKVQEREGAYGILICGTGIGMAMTANRLHGIRAVNAVTEEQAEMGRKHNNANVLTMGERLTPVPEMQRIAMKFLHTDFDDSVERHVRRVNKIEG